MEKILFSSRVLKSPPGTISIFEMAILLTSNLDIFRLTGAIVNLLLFVYGPITSNAF